MKRQKGGGKKALSALAHLGNAGLHETINQIPFDWYFVVNNALIDTWE